MLIRSSPRWWGCSVVQSLSVNSAKDLPHAGGGVPLLVDGTNHRVQIFPTLVGVFRTAVYNVAANYHLPHAGGGVPLTSGSLENLRVIFPTLVGVFRS